MHRLLLAALLLIAGLVGSAQAASTINSLPPITTSPGTFPLTDPGCTAASTENFWVTQGTGDFKIDALRSGYIFQGSTAPSYPFKYELWWNTAPTLPELDAYDGAQWLRITSIDASNHLLVPPIGGGVISPITSASTTDLCSQAPATVQVTGAATINAFGPTCPTGTIKFVNFASTPTIVYNGTSMILPGGANITVTAGEGWCGSCACLEGCCGYGETVFAVDSLQITSLADENGENEEVTFNEGDRLCLRCGEDVYFDNQDEADEAARWDAGERAWELAGDR